MNIFTRREQVVVEVVILLVLLFFMAPTFMSSINEYIYLFFIVLPLGLLIATDKERLTQLQNETSDPHRHPTDPS